MKEEYKELELVDNTYDQQFELTVGAHTAYIAYGKNRHAISLNHTVVPAELEGRGVGTAIVEKTLAEIEKRELKVIPICPFVVAYLKRHPEWNRIITPGYLHHFTA